VPTRGSLQFYKRVHRLNKKPSTEVAKAKGQKGGQFKIFGPSYTSEADPLNAEISAELLGKNLLSEKYSYVRE